MKIGHWALVPSVRVASRREVVGAASPRVVLGIGDGALIIFPSSLEFMGHIKEIEDLLIY
ncbi:MAG: hypothetical protein V7K41_19295 [Nostoc sp.]|uniref:hypothetical protein n=1 Tax=Nostoc sp. TaxID=1180 RepID=UPI002FF6A1DF